MNGKPEQVYLGRDIEVTFDGEFYRAKAYGIFMTIETAGELVAYGRTKERAIGFLFRKIGENVLNNHSLDGVQP